MVRPPDVCVGRVQAGEAEVGDLHPALGGDQDVGGLDVAVDDALAVRVVQRVADLAMMMVERLRGVEAGAVDDLVEIGALDELHDEVEVAFARGLAEVVDGDDARVAELGEGAGFALEAVGECRVGADLGGRSLMATGRSSAACTPL